MAVILIIAAIAIPNYLNSKMRANESSAVQNLRNISTAEVVYSTTYGVGFSTHPSPAFRETVTTDQNNAGLIDEILRADSRADISSPMFPSPRLRRDMP